MLYSLDVVCHVNKSNHIFSNSKLPVYSSFPIYYGWVIVFAVAFCNFIQTAESYPVLGVFLKPMTEEFGWSRTVFTGALTIGTLLGAGLSLLLGSIVDRSGGRWILSVSFSILGLMLLLTARVTSLWQFYVCQIIARMVSMGAIMLTLQIIIPKWFIEKRGRALAFGQVGLTSGNIVLPLYLQIVMEARDWRMAIMTMGVAVLCLSIPMVVIFIRRTPEDIGLLPDGVTAGEGVNLRAKTSFGKEMISETSFSLKEVVRLPSFYFLLISSSLVMLVAPGVFLHLIPYLTDKGLSPGNGVAAMAIVAGSAAIGSIVFGILGERYNPRVLLTACLLFMSFGYIFLIGVDRFMLAILWGVYMGSAQGGVFTTQQIILADYYGRDSIGSIRGVVWPAMVAANALSPLACSAVYDLNGSYTFVFLLFSLFIIFAALSVSIARSPQRKILLTGNNY
jgi:MFS family permease